MEFVKWGLNPWGQNILTHVSWTLFWASLFAGVMFFVAHGSYMLLSAHRRRPEAETDRLEVIHAKLPARIERHSLMARAFHWVMAASMFVLLFTAFLPVVGVRFAWVTWHWIAGLVLTGSILFHIVHATFFLDFWSIWVGPSDIPELQIEIAREMGREDMEGPRPGKYPLGNRLYHLAVMTAGLLVIATGVMMMWRVRNAITPRNPYILTDTTWGLTYVTHGLMGVGFVGLVIAHIYFALRPEKLWITKAMIFGYITKREYLEYHDPKRWVAEKTKN